MLKSRFWQGFFALAPIAGIFLLILGYVLFIFSIVGNLDHLDHNDRPPGAFFGSLGILMLIVFIMIVISLGSLVFYIVHAAKNPNLRQNNLLLVWILLFVFANGIGQLIYWIVEVLPRQGKSAEHGPAS